MSCYCEIWCVWGFFFIDVLFISVLGVDEFVVVGLRFRFVFVGRVVFVGRNIVNCCICIDIFFVKLVCCIMILFKIKMYLISVW